MIKEAKIPGANYSLTKDGEVTNLRTGKIIRGFISNKGYLRIDLRWSSIGKVISLHRLLAQAFIDNPRNLPCINHKDGNKLNNNLSNLEWCTHKENMRHAFFTGLVPFPPTGKGDACRASKLTENQVRIIKLRLAKGEQYRKIAPDYGVTAGTIGHIKYGKTWTHV